MSKKLVVVVRPQSLESDWVSKEVEECLAARRVPIAIDVNRTLENADDKSPVKSRLQDKLFLSETIEDLDANPSDTIISELIRSFRSTRQDTLRLRAVSIAAIVFAMVAAIAVWQYILAERQRKIGYSRELIIIGISQTQT